MRTLAIVPARGGSKGIPRKNVRPLAGKPLVAHTIEQAILSRSVDRVVVSTDDPEIGAVSQRYGAEVVWRPTEISGDSASSETALLHVLHHLRETEGYEPELLVFLQCTAPLTSSDDIDGTVNALLSEHADSAVAVTPFHYFLWRVGSQGEAEGINHDRSRRLLRQDSESQYLETGAIYVMRAAGFKESGHRFFGTTAMYVMPRERCLEIDEPVDFTIAEVLMRERGQRERLMDLPEPVAALVLDFDGVLTDNRVVVFQDSKEAVVCDRGDGWGLAQLGKLGIPVLVLSSEENPVVQARCDKLGLPCLHGIRAKLSCLEAWMEERGIDASQVVYVGNDINDLECLQRVGCGVAVHDAHPQAQAAAKIILSAPGGQGAVREICDMILVRAEEIR